MHVLCCLGVWRAEKSSVRGFFWARICKGQVTGKQTTFLTLNKTYTLKVYWNVL